MSRAGRIVPPATAFTTLRARKPRQKEDNHLRFVRTLPCVICYSRQGVQAAHIRMASLLHGKRQTGMSEKASDKWCCPLCPACHAEQHAGSEALFWQRHGINPFDLAARVYVHSGDEDAAEMVIKMARTTL